MEKQLAKRPEGSFEESEQSFQAIFDSVNDAIFVLEVTAGHVVYVNNKACEVFGYTREEFCLLNAGDLSSGVPPYTRQHAIDSMKRAAQGEDLQFEWHARDKAGRLFWAEVGIRGAMIGGIPRLLVTGRDITESRLAREILDDRLRFETLLADLSTAFINVAPGEVDDQIEHWLRRVIDATGIDRAAVWKFADGKRQILLSHHSTSAGIPDLAIQDMAEVFPWYAKIVRQGDRVLVMDRLPDSLPAEAVAEREYCIKSGFRAHVMIPLGAGGSALGALTFGSFNPDHEWTDTLVQRLKLVAQVFTNALQRQKSEEELRESESRFRTIFEEAPLGVAYVNMELRIVKANKAFREMMGYPEEELSKLAVFDITHPDDISRDASLARQLFNGEIPSYQLEKRFIKKGGAALWGLMTATLVRSKDGEVYGLGMVEDLTERKEVEDQLRQSQKMEAIGRLAGGVAHDFNNLLTAINGYSDLSIALLGTNDPIRANLEEIKKAGERAASLTHQLLAFSRKQLLQPEVLDLNLVIDDLNKMLRRLIGEDIELVTLLDPKLGKVMADRGQVEQIIVNLAINAADAMPKGGSLVILTANVFLDDEYARHHISVRPGAYVMIAVNDTGCGISPETQKRVFEPFFTTKGPGKGTGLGLATVYGIVKQSGGNIWLYSEEGVGTTLKIYLPRIDQPSQEPVEDESMVDAPGGTETILLVEDDDSVRNMVARILTRHGYNVIAAKDGREALRICERDQREFHLMLTDVVMPLMSGRDVAERLKPVRPNMKVLFMSGYPDDAIAEHGLLDEGVALLEKPFTIAGLLNKVREVLTTE
jgi:PAS domain S-box-containing protein